MNAALHIKACLVLELPFFFCNMQDRYNHRKVCDKGSKKLREFIPFSFSSSGPGNKVSIVKCIEGEIWGSLSSSPSNVSFGTSVFSKKLRKSPAI